jgi:hypothetical protein
MVQMLGEGYLIYIKNFTHKYDLFQVVFFIQTISYGDLASLLSVALSFHVMPT